MYYGRSVLKPRTLNPWLGNLPSAEPELALPSPGGSPYGAARMRLAVHPDADPVARFRIEAADLAGCAAHDGTRPLFTPLCSLLPGPRAPRQCHTTSWPYRRAAPRQQDGAPAWSRGLSRSRSAQGRRCCKWPIGRQARMEGEGRPQPGVPRTAVAGRIRGRPRRTAIGAISPSSAPATPKDGIGAWRAGARPVPLRRQGRPAGAAPPPARRNAAAPAAAIRPVPGLHPHERQPRRSGASRTASHAYAYAGADALCHNHAV